MAFISMTPGSTIGQRQQQYERLLGSQALQYQNAAQAASRRVLGDVASATQATGNPLAAGRMAANASRDAQVSLAARGAEAQQHINQQALQMAREDAQRQADQERQAIGGFLGGAGQLAGTVVGMMYGQPQLGSAIGGLGGGVLNGLVGGNQSAQTPAVPQAQQPQQSGLLGSSPQAPSPEQRVQQVSPSPQTSTPSGPAPSGMRWDPVTNSWVPVEPIQTT